MAPFPSVHRCLNTTFCIIGLFWWKTVLIAHRTWRDALKEGFHKNDGGWGILLSTVGRRVICVYEWNGEERRDTDTSVLAWQCIINFLYLLASNFKAAVSFVCAAELINLYAISFVFSSYLERQPNPIYSFELLKVFVVWKDRRV